MTEQDPKVLTVTEFCALYQISRKTAYRLIKKGCIPSLRVGRHHRIPMHAIAAWERERLTGGANA